MSEQDPRRPLDDVPEIIEAHVHPWEEWTDEEKEQERARWGEAKRKVEIEKEAEAAAAPKRRVAAVKMKFVEIAEKAQGIVGKILDASPESLRKAGLAYKDAKPVYEIMTDAMQRAEQYIEENGGSGDDAARLIRIGLSPLSDRVRLLDPGGTI